MRAAGGPSTQSDFHFAQRFQHMLVMPRVAAHIATTCSCCGIPGQLAATSPWQFTPDGSVRRLDLGLKTQCVFSFLAAPPTHCPLGAPSHLWIWRGDAAQHVDPRLSAQGGAPTAGSATVATRCPPRPRIPGRHGCVGMQMTGAPVPRRDCWVALGFFPIITATYARRACKLQCALSSMRRATSPLL